jgi:hypothetical protein
MHLIIQTISSLCPYARVLKGDGVGVKTKKAHALLHPTYLCFTKKRQSLGLYLRHLKQAPSRFLDELREELREVSQDELDISNSGQTRCATDRKDNGTGGRHGHC